MDSKTKLTFLKAEFTQYTYLLKDEEIRIKVSNFLLKYFSAEAFYKKLFIVKEETKHNRKLTQKEKKDINTTEAKVLDVMRFFAVSYNEDVIKRIFGSNDKNYMECSIKKLRDRLVHNVNDNVIRVILERYADIEMDLNEFIGYFKI